MSHSPVIIIGCGFAGTALALFLRRAGIQSEIYDARTATEADSGAFLYLAPNGMKVLRQLGLEQTLEQDGFPTTGIAFYNSRGKQIGQLDNRADKERHGVRGHVLKREHIFRVLRDEVLRQGIPIHFAKRLEGIEALDPGVAARFHDGSTTQGKILIGADGINSVTRQIIAREAKPNYAGLLDTGGFTYLPELRSHSGPQHMIFGKKAFFGYMVKPSGEVYWFSNLPQAKEPTTGELKAVAPQLWKQQLLELHADDPAPVLEIIRSTPADGLGRWPTRDLSPLATWHRGLICLMGDAAHATSPSAGQGASLALEDAIVLAKCLRDIPNSEQAFATFQGLRKGRVEQIVAQARRNGDRKIPGPLMGWFRDL